jgi:hypothetical protein
MSEQPVLPNDFPFFPAILSVAHPSHHHGAVVAPAPEGQLFNDPLGCECSSLNIGRRCSSMNIFSSVKPDSPMVL